MLKEKLKAYIAQYVNPTTGEDDPARKYEFPDPTPVAPPIGYNPQPSMADQIRQMVRSERLAQEARAAGAESFDEADDFDVGDDYEPSSPYEETFDPSPASVLRQRESAASAPAPDAVPINPSPMSPPTPPPPAPAAPQPAPAPKPTP